MGIIKNKWKDELYQNLEYVEYKLSLGPIINVYTLAGYQFSCNLLNLHNRITLHIYSNDTQNHANQFNNNQEQIKCADHKQIKHVDDNFNISIIIDDELLKSDYNDTCINMLEKYINNYIYELDITIIIKNKNNTHDSDNNDNHNIFYEGYDSRLEKLNKFYTKLILWKNYNMNIQLWSDYNLVFKKILYYIDFNDLFLNKQLDIGISALKTYYNIKIFNYDSDFEIDEDGYNNFFDYY
jgi:hypothetical protein